MSGDSNDNERGSLHELLLRLDLAMEVLEGLDELGLDTRNEVEALLNRLERQIAESSRVGGLVSRGRRGSL